MEFELKVPSAELVPVGSLRVDGKNPNRMSKRQFEALKKSIQNTLIYIDLESKLFNNSSDGFTSRVANNTGEACSLIEAGFEYVTGEYDDGGKIFRKRN
jgi:hypothetical protein